MKKKFKSVGVAFLIVMVTIMGTAPLTGTGSGNPPVLERP